MATEMGIKSHVRASFNYILSSAQISFISVAAV